MHHSLKALISSTFVLFLGLVLFLGVPSPLFANGLPVSTTDCQSGIAPSGGCVVDATTQGLYGINYSLTGNIASGATVGITFDAIDTTTLNYSGNITTTGISAAGVYFRTASNISYSMLGDITTIEDTAYGIYLLNSDSNTTTMTGDISTGNADGTTGDYAYGIFVNASDSNITTMTGDISTTGTSAYGLYLSSSDSNTTNLTGDISTTADSAYGLYFLGSNRNTTTLNGNILTNSAYNLLVAGGSSNNNFTIFGDITSGAIGFAMQSGSNYNNLTLTGNINTTYHGLQLSSVNNNIANISGNITTIGSNYPTGLYLQNSAQNAISLTGDINSTASSTNAFGVMLNQESDSNTINLTGSLSATGTGSSYAIYADSLADNNTITFNQGSQIMGGLYNAGTNNTLNFNLGRAASYNFTTSGSVDWVLNDTTKTVVAGSAKSRGAADLDDAGNRLYQRFHSVYDRLIQEQREVAQGSVRRDGWIDTYYTDSERDTVGTQINQETRGITAGFNVSGERDLAMDVIVNFENTDSGYGLSEQTIDTNSLMVGLSFPQLMTTNKGTLGVQFLAGMSDNDRTLVVLDNTLTTGKTAVNDDYNSTYASAGAQWLQALLTRHRFQSDLVIGMDVTHAQIEGSTASAYYVLADRDLTQLTTRAQFGFTYTSQDSKLRLHHSLGLAHANTLQGEHQEYTIDGTAVRYTADNSNTYATASLGATYQFTPNAQAYANVKRFDSTDDIDGTTGNVGLAIRF